MRILGVDVGGANMKIVIVKFYSKYHEVEEVIREYFPLWKRGREGLENYIKNMAEKFRNIDGISICMTAELCDIYSSKSEGVKHVVECFLKYFKHVKHMKFITCNLELVDYDYAIKNPLEIAAANWAASAWLISKLVKDCIFADIGSTTTTIIPVVDHKPIICGKNDPEKLTCGELAYIGTLRTSVSEIVRYLPYKGARAEICREYFATMADVNLVLGNITEKDYVIDTADGRGKSVLESAIRIARTVCSSLELMNIEEIIEIARYVYNEAINRIVESLILVRSRIANIVKNLREIPLITAGIGEFMLRDAGIRAGFSKIISVDDIVKQRFKIAPVFPSYAAAVMLYNYLESTKSSQ